MVPSSQQATVCDAANMGKLQQACYNQANPSRCTYGAVRMCLFLSWSTFFEGGRGKKEEVGDYARRTLSNPAVGWLHCCSPLSVCVFLVVALHCGCSGKNTR